MLLMTSTTSMKVTSNMTKTIEANIPNVVGRPLRNEPFTKTIGSITTLTFDNGRSVSYIEHPNTGMIMVVDPHDVRVCTVMTADQFALHIFYVCRLSDVTSIEKQPYNPEIGTPLAT